MWDTTERVLASSNGGSWHWDHPGWYGWMGMHAVVWLLAVTLIVVGLVALYRAAAREGSAAEPVTGSPSSSTREPGGAILDARYARGKIDRGEDLQGSRNLS